jgi:TRAP-type C4-dicarboxylate transport system substrate-binding protein
MSASRRLAVIVAVLAILIVPLAGAPSEIKLATLVPANSTWDKALRDMGSAWKKNTADRVTLTVYGGGTQGDEATIIRKMRSDVFQASFITSVGLAELDDAFNVFGIPFFLESSDEEVAVEKALSPVIEKRLQAKGLHLLCWGTGGWVQVFSKKPLRTLADVKAAKLFTSKGSDKWVQWYVANGFHPVALTPADIPAQLKLGTGLIDTAPYPAYLAMSLNIYTDAKYMLDLHIGPLTGALVITETAWNRLSAEDRAAIEADAQAFESRVRTEVPKNDAEAVKLMSTRGLQVITPDAKAAAEFRTAGSQLASTMRGSMVPADIYDAAVQARDAFRASKGK